MRAPHSGCETWNQGTVKESWMGRACSGVQPEGLVVATYRSVHG